MGKASVCQSRTERLFSLSSSGSRSFLTHNSQWCRVIGRQPESVTRIQLILNDTPEALTPMRPWLASQ
ncbi:hypothetical protein ROHU_023897 [Labeo rohita]|uniref:Uncharacterized protein n=1 Tax=Labeo rohita TaxID=84645 RepID=A0A498MYN0_LABRO|nr:hypothetical protein ROHU_023897 [Labeo rohita]